MKNKEKGFNLLATVLVMAIIIIIASIVLFGEDPDKRIGMARDAQRSGDVAAIIKALDLYMLDNGSLPSDIENAPMDAGEKIVLCDQPGVLTCGEQTWDCLVIDDADFLELLGGQLPVDPEKSNTNDTGYYITRASNNDAIIIGSCENYDTSEIVIRAQASYAPLVVAAFSDTSYNDFVDAVSSSSVEIFGSGDSAVARIQGDPINGVIGTGLVSAYDFNGGYMWSTKWSSGKVSKIDIDTKDVKCEVDVQKPMHATYDPVTHSIWVGSNDWNYGYLRQIDADDCTVLFETKPYHDPYNTKYVSSTVARSIWTVWEAEGMLTQHDPIDGSLITTTTIGSTPKSLTYDVTNDAIWTFNTGDETVSKVDASDGSVLGTYSVGTSTTQGEYDPSTESIWVSGSGSDVITKIDASDGSVLGTYSVGDYPTAVLYEDYTQSIWVINKHDANVMKLDPSDASVRGTFHLSGDAQDMVFDPVNNHIWIGDGTNGHIIILDTLTGKRINSYAVGTSPNEIMYEDYTQSIWVSTDDNTVQKINPSTGSVVGTYSVGNKPYSMAFDPITNSVWVANADDDTVSKLSASTGSVIGTYSVGNQPEGMVYDPVNESIWVSNYQDKNIYQLDPIDGSFITSTPNFLGGVYHEIIFDNYTDSIWALDNSYAVNKIDVTDASIVTSSPHGGGYRTDDLTFDSYTNSVWLARDQWSGRAIKVDIIDGGILDTYVSGNGTVDVTFDPITNTIWAANDTDENVVQIDPTDGSIIGSFAAGDEPTGIVFETKTNAVWVIDATDDTITKMPNIIFASTGSITSNIYDTVSNIAYSTIDWTANVPSGTSMGVKVRTSNDSDMSGAAAFSTCAPVSNGIDISSNNCVTDGHRYAQYQVIFNTSYENISPSLEDITINFKKE